VAGNADARGRARVIDAAGPTRRVSGEKLARGDERHEGRSQRRQGLLAIASGVQPLA